MSDEAIRAQIMAAHAQVMAAVEAGEKLIDLGDFRQYGTVDGSPHVYLSTACVHGDMPLPDGRTGHEYCRSELGHKGAKRPAECKFCQTGCVCPCHGPVEPRLLDCGLCYEEMGEEVHPHPECPIGRNDLRDAVEALRASFKHWFLDAHAGLTYRALLEGIATDMQRCLDIADGKAPSS